MCCTTPGIDTTGSGASMPSFTNSGATRSSTRTRCSATSRRSAGVRRSRRSRCSGNDTPRWYRSALDRVRRRRLPAAGRRRARRSCADRPRRRRAARGRAPSRDVTGPIEIDRPAARRSSGADRVAEVVDRRRRRERDRVDLAGAHARDVGGVGRRPGRSGRPRARRPRSPAPRDLRAARRARPPPARAAPARRRARGSGNASSSDSATNRSGTRSARTPRRASASLGARSDRGDAHGGERAGVEPGGREATVEERVDTVGRREHDPGVRGRASGSVEVDRLERDRRQLDHLGAELLEARAQLARLLARPGHDDAPAEQRALLEPAEVEAGDRRRRRSRSATRRRASAIVASVPRIVRCSGRVPHRTAATGVAASRPPAINASAISATRPAPISTTSVPPARASASQSVSVAALGRVLVPGHDREARRQAAVRHRDARVRGRRDRARDAGHDLERRRPRRGTPRPLRRRARTRTGRRPSAARPRARPRRASTSSSLICSCVIATRPGRLARRRRARRRPARARAARGEASRS